MAASRSRGNPHKYCSESKTDLGEIKKMCFLGLVWSMFSPGYNCSWAEVNCNTVTYYIV